MVTSQEKGRLFRIAKRPQKGPFNAIVDPTEPGHGSALLEPSEAVKQSGQYNIWAEGGPADPKVTTVLKKDEAKDFIGEIINKPDPKVRSTFPFAILDTLIRFTHSQAPTTSIREVIMAPAVSDPHRGISYNPPQDAYSELLETAIQAEQKRVAEEEEYAKTKDEMENARHVLPIDAPRGAEGMTIDTPMEDAAEDPLDGEGEEVIEVIPTKVPMRKTKQQRRKARRVLAEVREGLVGGWTVYLRVLLACSARRRRTGYEKSVCLLLSTVSSLSSWRWRPRRPSKNARPRNGYWSKRKH